MNDLVDEYSAATGDTWPEKPTRLFVSREKNQYTKKAAIWIKAARSFELRMAKWYLAKMVNQAEEDDLATSSGV